MAAWFFFNGLLFFPSFFLSLSLRPSFLTSFPLFHPPVYPFVPFFHFFSLFLALFFTLPLFFLAFFSSSFTTLYFPQEIANVLMTCKANIRVVVPHLSVSQTFQKPLLESELLTEKEVAMIFVNWKELIMCNIKLLKYDLCCFNLNYQPSRFKSTMIH